MDIQDIVQALKQDEGPSPRQAFEVAVAQRDAIIPVLLQIIEDATAHAQEIQERPGAMEHIYAMYLLAQFREPRAYPVIVAFFSLPGDLALDLTGDVVTEAEGEVQTEDGQSVEAQEPALDVHFVSPAPVERHARPRSASRAGGGHPVPSASPQEFLCRGAS